MKTFTTVSDLRLWVSERSGETTSAEDNSRIASAIQSMETFPAYGEDAEDFLAELPDDLCKIIVKGFRISDDNHSEIIESDDMDAACDYAEEKWKNGSWDSKCRITLSVQEIDRNEKEIGDAKTFEVECGEDPAEPCDEHDWQSPHSLVRGLKENPGVWSLGGTTTKYKEVCALTGWYKITIRYGVQRNPGQCDSIEYSEPDAASIAWVESRVAKND